eukprot:6275256-Karenia_brevis.AAC.1
MDESLTLAQLFAKHSVPQDIADELAVQPFGITTVQQLSNYFDNKAEVKSLFFDQCSKKDEGN